MKTKWTKKSPTMTGWYWVKYQGKNGKVICPAKLLEISYWGQPFVWTLRTAKNDLFYSKSKTPRKDLWFGNKIEQPK